MGHKTHRAYDKKARSFRARLRLSCRAHSFSFSTGESVMFGVLHEQLTSIVRFNWPTLGKLNLPRLPLNWLAGDHRGCDIKQARIGRQSTSHYHPASVSNRCFTVVRYSASYDHFVITRSSAISPIHIHINIKYTVTTCDLRSLSESLTPLIL